MDSTTSLKSLKSPPIARGSSSLENLLGMRRDPMLMMAEARKKYGDVVGIPLLGGTNCFVFHPDGIKRILVDNNKNYHKHVLNYRIIYPIVGHGLLTSDGDFWRRQRKLAQPAFHRARIASFGKMMVQESMALAQRWESAAQEEQPLNIEKEMIHLTLNIVGRALLNINLGGGAERFGNAFIAANETFDFHHLFSILYPWLPTPTNIKRKISIRKMDNFVYGIIHERRRMAPDQRPQDDLLALLMSAVDEETGESMDDRQLRDEIITILLAGHETTAIGLTWTWYFLSLYPEILAKVREEHNRVLRGRLPTIEDVPALEYTRNVFQEALRFYPPAWTIARGAFEDDEICGYRIPKDTVVQLNIHLLHHDPRFWEDPEQFDPDRFTPERSAKRHRYAYLPFSIGPRKCIGDQFALTEAVLILATLVSQYDLRLAPGQKAETRLLITQRPKNGMLMYPLAREI